MITISTKKINGFNQNNYNKIIEELPFHKLLCTCGQAGQLIKHSYYTRSIKQSNGFLDLRVLRVKCKSCNKTHAILLQFIVPYSQILLHDQISIITSYENKSSFETIMLSNLLIDESNIRYIISRYLKIWKERLIAFELKIDKCISYKCFLKFKKQFMQIKRGSNILFSQTHIT